MGVAEGWPTVTVVVCSGLGQAEDLCSHAMALAARAERATVYFILVVVWGSRVEEPSVLVEKGGFLVVVVVIAFGSLLRVMSLCERRSQTPLYNTDGEGFVLPVFQIPTNLLSKVTRLFFPTVIPRMQAADAALHSPCSSVNHTFSSNVQPV